jgi:hypothetical protein
MKTDVRVEPIVDEDEPERFSKRRLIRWAVVVFLGVLAFMAILQEPLYALRH